MPIRAAKPRPAAWRRATAWTALGLMFLGPGAAWAGPEGERVRRGRADFERAGDHTEITTHTRRTVIDYDHFDIAEHESVHIEQPTERSRVLNRVLSNDPSAIDGVLTSNGRVWIANPAGIFFGNRAIVDVGSLVAGAGEISNRDLRRGRLRVSNLSGDVVVAEGAQLRAGEALLLAGRHVANYGHVEVPGGMVALLAGDRVELLRPSGGVRVVADAANAPETPAVVQGGEIDARGGSVSLVAGDAWSLAMNRGGITRADDLHVEAGRVDVSGTLDASGAGEDARGGRVRVLGDAVVLEAASIDVSGAAGGGEILVGGDLQGRGATRTATHTWVGSDSELRADAGREGDGGRIIVWADEATRFYGTLSARGGETAGDGGFAEISGRHSLVSRGAVDLGAAAGEVGTLLYDPLHIRILGGSLDGSDRKAEEDRLRGKGDNTVKIRFGDEAEGGAVTPFEIYESELENTDANIVLQAERSIRTEGSFDGNDVVIAPGRDLTLEVRDDGGALEETAGIDIRSSDGGDLTWVLSEGGSLTLITTGSVAREGGAGIVVGDVVARTAPGGEASTVSIAAAGRGDIEVGDLDLRGLDATADPGDDDLGVGGAGGLVALEAAQGVIRVGSILATGGAGRIESAAEDAPGVGGVGGTIGLLADPFVPAEGEPAPPAGTPTIVVSGELDARGGEGLGTLSDSEGEVFGTRGGRGGRILVSAGLGAQSQDDGGVEIQGSVDASAGAGSAAGGSASLGATSPVTGALTGAIRIESFGDIAVNDLRARGGDAGLAGGFGGTGGDASLEASDGDVLVSGDVDLGGGAGSADAPEIEADGDVRFPGQGGSAGSLTVATAGDGASIELQGSLAAVGGDGQNGAGGAGGSATLSAADGPITLAAVDLSGGAGSGFAGEAEGATADTGARGGNGGNLIASAARDEAGDFDGGDVTALGDVVSLGGAGVDPDDPLGDEDLRENHGVGGLVRLESERDVLGVGAPLLRGGSVELAGENLSGLVVAASGDASPDSFEDRASFAASGAAALELDENAGGGETAFDGVEAAARGVDASFDVSSSDGSTRIQGSGAGDTHTLTAFESGADDPLLVYRLLGPPDEEADQIGARTLAVADSAVALGSAGGAVVNARQDATRPSGERLLGAVVGAVPGAGLSSEGSLDVVGTSVRDLSVSGGGPEASLFLRVGGEVMDVAGDGLASLVLEQRNASADAAIDLDGGDRIEIAGEVIDDGASRIESSRVSQVDTTASGTDFHYDLIDATASSNDPGRGEPVLLVDGPIALGGDGGFAAAGDLVLLSTIDATAGAGAVALLADSNGSGVGALVPIGGGVLDVDGASALRLGSGEGVGSETDPLRTRTDTELALAGTAGAGDLWLHNEAGELAVAPIEVAALGLDADPGDAVLFAEGDVDLDNADRVIRFGELGEGVSAPHVRSGGGQRYQGPVRLANPSEVETTDPETGDPVTELRHEVSLVAGGDVVFESDVDTDDALLAVDRPGSLDVQSGGTVRFRGDVGRDVAGAASVDRLALGDVLFEGDRSVTVHSADFRGSLDGEGELALRGLGDDSELRFAGDVGSAAAPTRFDADADGLVFDGGRRLRAGEVLLNAATPAASVPELATIVATGGGLRIESEGDTRVGAREKLTSAGRLRIRSGGEVALGDVSATEIDIRAERLVVLGRERAPVQLADGGIRVDDGVDWVANTIRSNAAPEWDGVGREPTLVIGDGSLSLPGGLPFPLIFLDDSASAVSAARLEGANGTLDLFGTGPIAAADPGEELPRPETLALARPAPRASGAQPVAPPLPGAEQVIDFVRCRTAAGEPCEPDGFGAPEDSALASERAREIVRRYHELVASDRGRVELGRAFAPLADVEDPQRALGRAPELAAARARLDALGVVLAQISLLGLGDSDTEAVRRAVAADFGASAGVAALDAEAVLEAVSRRGVGTLP